MTNALQAQVDTPSPAAIAKSLDQTSKLSIEGNPFESLANLKPSDQSTETVIEACIILAKSVTDSWRQYGSWLSDLKQRMEVRNGSKGKQLPIGGAMLYWHESLTKYFDVSRRQINRIEEEVTAGTYPLHLVVGLLKTFVYTLLFISFLIPVFFVWMFTAHDQRAELTKNFVAEQSVYRVSFVNKSTYLVLVNRGINGDSKEKLVWGCPHDS